MIDTPQKHAPHTPTVRWAENGVHRFVTKTCRGQSAVKCLWLSLTPLGRRGHMRQKRCVRSNHCAAMCTFPATRPRHRAPHRIHAPKRPAASTSPFLKRQSPNATSGMTNAKPRDAPQIRGEAPLGSAERSNDPALGNKPIMQHHLPYVL